MSNNCEPMLFFLDRVSERRKAQQVSVTEYTRHESSIDKGCDRAGFASASQVRSIRVVAPKMDPYEWQKVLYSTVLSLSLSLSDILTYYMVQH